MRSLFKIEKSFFTCLVIEIGAPPIASRVAKSLAYLQRNKAAIVDFIYGQVSALVPVATLSVPIYIFPNQRIGPSAFISSHGICLISYFVNNYLSSEIPSDLILILPLPTHKSLYATRDQDMTCRKKYTWKWPNGNPPTENEIPGEQTCRTRTAHPRATDLNTLCYSSLTLRILLQSMPTTKSMTSRFSRDAQHMVALEISF